MPYNFVADSFHTKKLCSRLSSSEVRFYTENGCFAFLSPRFGWLRGNVRWSSYAYCKARSGLLVSVMLTCQPSYLCIISSKYASHNGLSVLQPRNYVVLTRDFRGVLNVSKAWYTLPVFGTPTLVDNENLTINLQ